MVTKVLVFESDPGFSGELRSEFGKLGCSTILVEDGALGLQQAAADRPDLILLSIELPRMNGFSVCNKLKKDPGLKDVPLIIMSSESSDETFEQHKKLRTRAEDYVHKPIAFGELLQHIQKFVPLAAVAHDSDGAIVIDDEIEIGSTDYLADEGSGDLLSDIPPAAPAPQRVETVDADVDAFAESAFGRLTEPDAPFADVHIARNGSAHPPPATLTLPGGLERPPEPLRPSGVPPPPIRSGVDPAEHARVREELDQATVRLRELGRALEDLQGDLGNVEELRAEAELAEQRGRELEELKARLAASPKAGAVSSREFLDLREALNKKDKELLTLKELISKKDKQIVEAQDRALASERARSDVDERLLELERELGDTKDRSESLVADRDLAKKASEDFRTRLEKARADAETKERQIAELKSHHAEELGAAEERFASMRAELDQTLANERAEHARALDEAEGRRKAEIEQARRESDERLGGAQHEWQQHMAQALAEAERRGRAALDELRAELQTNAARELAEESGRSAKLAGDLSTVREEVAALSRLRDDLEGKVADREGRIASLDAELATTRQQLALIEQTLASESTRADRALAKWQADRQSLERAKDALAVALSQIEEAEERV